MKESYQRPSDNQADYTAPIWQPSEKTWADSAETAVARKSRGELLDRANMETMIANTAWK